MTTTSILVLMLSGFQATSAEAQCDKLLSRKNMQEYADIVAHATHSLTLNEIRAFFKADVDEYNGIPIVNFNLTDNQTVLPNAPLIDSRYY